MPELPSVDQEMARRLCGDNYGKGRDIFKAGSVANAWRASGALGGEVAGSASRPYQVGLSPRDDGSFTARCTCPAARRQSLCKHAAALLIAWAEKPGTFAVAAEPAAAEGKPKVESQAKRARQPKVERRTLFAAGLERAESLLVDLCSHGLLTITAEQVEMIGSLAETLEAHKLRRLARQVSEIGSAAAAAQKGGDAFADRAWAALLGDTWFVLAATRKALEKGEGADQAELEDLVGKTWLEKDLRKLEGLEMVELAYQTLVLSSGFRVETSYLLELGGGTLYAEKQIVPLRLKEPPPPKRCYTLPLRVASAGVYPGFPPPRVKLISVEESASAGDAWDRAMGLAETSLAALRHRLSQATTNLVAPQEVFSLFRPASVLVEGESIHLIDGEGRAVSLSARPRAPLYALRGALAGSSLGALFGRVRFAGDAMVAEPLSAILGKGASPERLARFTA